MNTICFIIFHYFLSRLYGLFDTSCTSAICSLQFVVCSLQFVVCSLQFAVTSPLFLSFSRMILFSLYLSIDILSSYLVQSTQPYGRGLNLYPWWLFDMLEKSFNICVILNTRSQPSWDWFNDRKDEGLILTKMFKDGGKVHIVSCSKDKIISSSHFQNQQRRLGKLDVIRKRKKGQLYDDYADNISDMYQLTEEILIFHNACFYEHLYNDRDS